MLMTFFSFSLLQVWFEEKIRTFGAFRNLKNLSLRLLDWCMDLKKFNPIAWFVKNSPNLNMLTLYFPERQIDLGRCPVFTISFYHGLRFHSVLRRRKQRTVFDEIAYNHSTWLQLSQLKKLKQVEIKFHRNITSRDNFEMALFQNMNLKNVKVVVSEIP
jgi:hypothetical protein